MNYIDYAIGLVLIIIGLILIVFNKSKNRHFGWGFLGAGCYFLFKALGISPI